MQTLKHVLLVLLLCVHWLRLKLLGELVADHSHQTVALQVGTLLKLLLRLLMLLLLMLLLRKGKLNVFLVHRRWYSLVFINEGSMLLLLLVASIWAGRLLRVEVLTVVLLWCWCLIDLGDTLACSWHVVVHLLRSSSLGEPRSTTNTRGCIGSCCRRLIGVWVYTVLLTQFIYKLLDSKFSEISDKWLS